MEELKLRQHEIPAIATSFLLLLPNEVTSARNGMLLHRNGILRVRPLLEHRRLAGAATTRRNSFVVG